MILNETVAAIADAIREKTGKSELIKPVDFATEIKGITAGGGSGGNSEEVRYFDVTNCSSEIKEMLSGYSAFVIGYNGDYHYIVPSCVAFSMGTSNTQKIAICPNFPMHLNIYASVINPERLKTVASILQEMQFDQNMSQFGVTEITEAEFYTLE